MHFELGHSMILLFSFVFSKKNTFQDLWPLQVDSPIFCQFSILKFCVHLIFFYFGPIFRTCGRRKLISNVLRVFPNWLVTDLCVFNIFQFCQLGQPQVDFLCFSQFGIFKFYLSSIFPHFSQLFAAASRFPIFGPVWHFSVWLTRNICVFFFPCCGGHKLS